MEQQRNKDARTILLSPSVSNWGEPSSAKDPSESDRDSDACAWESSQVDTSGLRLELWRGITILSWFRSGAVSKCGTISCPSSLFPPSGMAASACCNERTEVGTTAGSGGCVRSNAAGGCCGGGCDGRCCDGSASCGDSDESEGDGGGGGGGGGGNGIACFLYCCCRNWCSWSMVTCNTQSRPRSQSHKGKSRKAALTQHNRTQHEC